MDRSAVTRHVWELAEPLCVQQGLELVDVVYRPEAGRMVLRLLIDWPDGGITLDQLALVSRELGDLLDGHDAVPGRYQLECSSPGLNRPLTREAHYRRAVGQRVGVRTREPLGGRRRFHGVLEAVGPDGVTVRDPDAGTVFVAFGAIERANTEYDFGRPAGARPASA